MKVATFNVNSIRARLPVVLDWLGTAGPDVLVVQETKVEDEKFPFEDLEPAGYAIKIHGAPRYNGVAILSKLPMDDIEVGQGPDSPSDCRVMAATISGVRIINTYVPNGNAVGNEKWAYKMRWLEWFERWIAERHSSGDKVLWLGDINIARTDDDVYEGPKHLGDVGHHPDEFSRLDKILEWGWTDCFRKFTQGAGHYTFWDFRMPRAFDRNLGWRIDHIYASPGLVDACIRCEIDTDPRCAERPSDHTPVWAELGD